MYPSRSGRLLRDMYRLDGKNWYIQEIQSHIGIFQVEKREIRTNIARQSRACVSTVWRLWILSLHLQLAPTELSSTE